MDNLQLRFRTPETEAEFESVYADFKFLANFFPFKMSDEDFDSFLKDRIGFITLVYVNHILIGAFVMDIYTKSVELHGVCRPDIAKVIPNHKQVKAHINRMVFNDIFLYQEKPRVFIKFEPDNKGAAGYARLYGFHKLPKLDRGREVWVLTKKNYFERLNKNVQRSQGYNPVNSNVAVQG